MLLGFFDLCFELCLPFLSTFLIIAVFLELSSSSIPRYANLYHHCAVFLLSSFTSPLLCWDFQKASCSSVATLRPGPSSQEQFFCLFALCPEEPCLFSYNTQAISRLYMCSFDFLDNSFSQDRFHSLHGVCSPYPFACWYKFIPPSISCGNPWVLFCQSDLFSLSSIYLLSAPTFYLLYYLT